MNDTLIIMIINGTIICVVTLLKNCCTLYAKEYFLFYLFLELLVYSK